MLGGADVLERAVPHEQHAVLVDRVDVVHRQHPLHADRQARRIRALAKADSEEADREEGQHQ